MEFKEVEYTKQKLNKRTGKVETKVVKAFDIATLPDGALEYDRVFNKRLGDGKMHVLGLTFGERKKLTPEEKARRTAEKEATKKANASKRAKESLANLAVKLKDAEEKYEGLKGSDQSIASIARMTKAAKKKLDSLLAKKKKFEAKL
jgi:hypothetical protein